MYTLRDKYGLRNDKYKRGSAGKKSIAIKHSPKESYKSIILVQHSPLHPPFFPFTSFLHISFSFQFFPLPLPSPSYIYVIYVYVIYIKIIYIYVIYIYVIYVYLY